MEVIFVVWSVWSLFSGMVWFDDIADTFPNAMTAAQSNSQLPAELENEDRKNNEEYRTRSNPGTGHGSLQSNNTLFARLHQPLSEANGKETPKTRNTAVYQPLAPILM